jgi:translation initiation factor 3 subunit C
LRIATNKTIQLVEANMSRFWAGGAVSDDSDDDDEDDKKKKKRGKKKKGSSDDDSSSSGGSSSSSSSSSSSEDDDDDDDSDDGKKGDGGAAGGGAGAANRWMAVSDDESSSEDEVRVVKSGKERTQDAYELHIKNIRAAMKLRDYATIQLEFDLFTKQLTNTKTQTLFRDVGVPLPVVRILVDLELYVAARLQDKVAFQSLSARQGRALNRMKLTLKKHNKAYAVVMEEYRKNPMAAPAHDDDDDQPEDEEFDPELEDRVPGATHAHDGDDDSSKSSSSSSSSSVSVCLPEAWKSSSRGCVCFNSSFPMVL